MALTHKGPFYVVARFKNHFTSLQCNNLVDAKNLLFELTDGLLREDSSIVKGTASDGKEFEFKVSDLTAVELILDPSLLAQHGYKS